MEYYVGLDVSLKQTSICGGPVWIRRARGRRRFRSRGDFSLREVKGTGRYVSASRLDRRLLGYGLSLSGLAYR
jgi:hypothetical protein